jgi:hypothetical protein
MLRRALIAIGATVALCAAPALAAQQDFELHNKSGHTINNIYVSPTSEDHWGSDILGQDTLGDGETLQIGFDRGESECNWDVKATFTDGTSAEVRGVDFCTVSDVNVTD